MKKEDVSPSSETDREYMRLDRSRDTRVCCYVRHSFAVPHTIPKRDCERRVVLMIFDGQSTCGRPALRLRGIPRKASVINIYHQNGKSNRFEKLFSTFFAILRQSNKQKGLSNATGAKVPRKTQSRLNQLERRSLVGTQRAVGKSDILRVVVEEHLALFADQLGGHLEGGGLVGVVGDHHVLLVA